MINVMAITNSQLLPCATLAGAPGSSTSSSSSCLSHRRSTRSSSSLEQAIFRLFKATGTV